MESSDLFVGIYAYRYGFVPPMTETSITEAEFDHAFGLRRPTFCFVVDHKDECLERMIFVGQESLRRAVAEYMTHYHAERNHQGLENRLIASAAVQAKDGAVLRYARLGGTLNFYYRKAA